MTVRTSLAERRFSFVPHDLLVVLPPTAILLWIAVVSVGGAWLALQSALPANQMISGLSAGSSLPDVEILRTLSAAAVVFGACLVASLTSRALRPAATLPATFVMGGILVIAAAVATRSIGALLIAILLCAVAWLIGVTALLDLPFPEDVAIVQAPLAIGIGFGLLGLLYLLLATMHQLNIGTVVASMLFITGAILAFKRDRLARKIAKIRTAGHPIPSWFETAVIGLTVGMVSFAVLTSFVPETMLTASDSVRQHLPIAREIWQTGSIGEFPQLGASRAPIQGHLLYAVAYGLGGFTASKLVQVAVGLSAIFAVGGLGWLGGGRQAATFSAAIFGTLPLGMWALGHAYPDLFAVLFVVTAAICVVLWQRGAAPVWLIVAGSLAGFGFATKLISGLLIVSLGVGIVLVGRARWNMRARLFAALVFGLGTIVVVPWMIRTYGITGSLPGIDTLLDLIRSILPNLPAGPMPVNVSTTEIFPQSSAGLGRGFLDILRGPWDLTFVGGPSRYHVIARGEFGIALLMLLPLVLLGPRTRIVTFLGVTVLASFVGWIYTIQVPRHLLPTVALAAAMVGIGLAACITSARTPPRKYLALGAQAGLVFAMLTTPLFFLPNTSTRLPIDLITGQVTTPEFINREIESMAALAAASDLLPPDTVVGYIGQWEGPQLYTEARLTYLGTYSEDDQNLLDNQLGSTPAEILAHADAMGMSYVIWDRNTTRPEDWQSTLLSGTFLRKHARILAGDNGVYLFQLLPDSGRAWGVNRLDNLLSDPEFDTVSAEYGPWTITGKGRLEDDVLVLRRDSSIAQKVPVSSGNPLLLVATAACASDTARTDLEFRWLDDEGALLATDKETVFPGREENDQFLWRRAPEGATSVSAGIATTDGARCEFDKLVLFDVS